LATSNRHTSPADRFGPRQRRLPQSSISHLYYHSFLLLSSRDIPAAPAFDCYPHYHSALHCTTRCLRSRSCHLHLTCTLHSALCAAVLSSLQAPRRACGRHHHHPPPPPSPTHPHTHAHARSLTLHAGGPLSFSSSPPPPTALSTIRSVSPRSYHETAQSAVESNLV
jgi:hypothetical protein